LQQQKTGTYLAGKHLEHDGTDRPEVGLFAVSVIQEDLWSHVERRTHEGGGQVTRLDETRKTGELEGTGLRRLVATQTGPSARKGSVREVGNLEAGRSLVRREKKVLRLQVAMNDPLVPQELEAERCAWKVSTLIKEQK
jgi:hypothetical protein